jgi:phosphodiesterase/alkaline phosphatase D-like protein
MTFDSLTSYMIAWTAPSDDGGSPATLDYEVWTDGGLGLGYSMLISTTSKTTSYTVTGLTTGTTYFYKVKAFTEVCSSSMSTSAGFLAGSIPS